MSVQINPDKYITLNGKKIFVVGLHSLCSQDITAEPCNPGETAEFNYKASPTYGPVGGEWWETYIPKLEAAEIGWVAFYSSHGTLPDRWKNSPSFVGYLQPDEPNPGNPKNLFPSTMTLQEVIAKIKEFYEELKRNDPAHLVVLGHWEQMLRWAPYCDISAWDTYTIGKSPYWLREDSLYAYEHYSEAAFFRGTDLNMNKNPVWGVIQANGIDFKPRDDFIQEVATYREAKANAWVAITMDVRGLTFWTYHHKFPDGTQVGLDQNPAARSYYKKIAAELKNLNNILTLPTADYSWHYHPGTMVTFDKKLTKKVLWSNRTNFNYILKKGSEDYYLIIVNKDSISIQNVKITIAPLTNQKIAQTIGTETDGSGKAGRVINISNKQIIDSFDGYAVHIYKLANTTCKVPACDMNIKYIPL